MTVEIYKKDICSKFLNAEVDRLEEYLVQYVYKLSKTSTF